MVEVNLIPKEYKEKKERIGTVFSKTGGIVLVLLILSLLLYGGLLFYQNKLNENLKDIREETINLDQRRDPETEGIIVDLDKKIEAVKGLFENHVYWSELFAKVEALTLPEVYFSGVNFEFSDNAKLLLGGNALTYTTIARQMLSFQEDSSVEEVGISGISLSSDGGVDFDLEVIFSKDILLNHAQ